MPEREPGTEFSYSGGGYTLMQLLIEEVTGQSFAEYARAAVLKPLAMNSSSYQPDDTLLARSAQGHDARGAVLPHYQFTAQAAANLHTTAEDLARVAIANMGANPVLEAEQLALMHRAVNPDRPWNGSGFFLNADGRMVGHGGSNIGWRALLSIVPETGDALVLLTNGDGGQRLFLDVECYWDEQLGAALLTSLYVIAYRVVPMIAEQQHPRNDPSPKCDGLIIGC